MVEYKKGYFARSKAGHDKGKLYIIIEGTDTGRPEDFILLADGECKLLEKPKKKRVKHVQVIKTCDALINQLLENDLTIRNEDIRLAVKRYNNK